MVSKQTNFYVEVVPAKRADNDLLKKIRKLLLEKIPREWREKIMAIPNEKFHSFIPFGRGEVILK
jgi:hypothetical protein